jgi:hypothetical protein
MLEVMNRNTRIGLFGIGLDAYWPQFAGLEERLKGYLTAMECRLARPGVDVVNLGLIDNAPCLRGRAPLPAGGRGLDLTCHYPCVFFDRAPRGAAH